MEAERVLMAMSGPWRIFHYIGICTLRGIVGAFAMFGNTFLGAEPSHHCRIPEGNNLNESVPHEEEDGKMVPDKCLAYKNFSYLTGETEDCPNGWQYGSEMHTIVDSWDLVCDKDYLANNAQTILVGGVMVGAFITPIFADRYGRKIVLLVSSVAIGIIGCITAVVDNYNAFVVLRFTTGIFQQGLVLSTFVLCCEMFPTSTRTVAGTLLQLFWAGAMCLLSLVAYLIPHWRHLLIAISVPGFLGIPLYWVFPESPSWLLAKHRYSEVKKLLELSMKWNKKATAEDKEILQGLLDDLTTEQKQIEMQQANATDSASTDEEKIKSDITDPEDKVTHYSMLDIFKSRRLVIFAVINLVTWCTTTLVYYGLSFSSGDLSSDIYLGFFLSGAVEIPAHLSSSAALHYIGRRWPISMFYIISALGVLISMSVPETTGSGTDLTPLIITSSMIGKFGITATFTSVFLWVPEFYPTTLRNVGIGLASVGGRIGNICAPFSAYVARDSPIVIGAVFALLSCMSAGLSLLLPETRGRAMPLSIAEVESWSRTVSKEEMQAFKQRQREEKARYRARPTKVNHDDLNTRF